MLKLSALLAVTVPHVFGAGGGGGGGGGQCSHAAKNLAQYEEFRVIVKDERLLDLVSADAKAHITCSGHKWVEGPAYIPRNKKTGEKDFVLYSDIPNNQIWKWSAKDGCSVWLEEAGATAEEASTRKLVEAGTNGLAVDPVTHELSGCQHGNRQVVSLDRKGVKKVFARQYAGARLSAPNDLVFAPNGDVYFTDPGFGLMNHVHPNENFPAAQHWVDQEQAPAIFHWRRSDGAVTKLSDEMHRPNGIGLSPCHKYLYVANCHYWGKVGEYEKSNFYLKRWDITPTGQIEHGVVLFNLSNVARNDPSITPSIGFFDGLTVDEYGNIWVAGPGGIHVIDPNGVHLGILYTGDLTANIVIGDDFHAYIACNTRLLRVPVFVKPAVANPSLAV